MPRTEAGKRWMQTPAAQVVTGMADAIDAIEAEARKKGINDVIDRALADGAAVERARIRASVGKYIAHHNHEPKKNCVSAFCAAGLHTAILRIIETDVE